jgi:hypothetical protein
MGRDLHTAQTLSVQKGLADEKPADPPDMDILRTAWMRSRGHHDEKGVSLLTEL